MKLNELPKILAFSKPTKRKGKGVGSGQGKTAGRGHKGGKARSGYSPAPCCSGIPFYRHFPIRGFSNARFKNKYTILSLKALADLDLETVDKACMLQYGFIKNSRIVVKVLGGVSLEKPLNIIADKFSKSAILELERSGGKAVSLLNLPNE